MKPPKANQGERVGVRADSSSPPTAEHVSFSLRHVKKTKWCITGCDIKLQKSFLKKLKSLTRMTWAEVATAPKHGLGFEYVSSAEHVLPAEARGARAMVFRFHDKLPMIGFRDGNVFYAVCFDKKMKAYDHG